MALYPRRGNPLSDADKRRCGDPARSTRSKYRRDELARDRANGLWRRDLCRRRYFLPPRGRRIAHFAPRARRQRFRAKRRPAARQGRMGNPCPAWVDAWIVTFGFEGWRTPKAPSITARAEAAIHRARAPF